MGPSRIPRRTRSPMGSERELDWTVGFNAIHSAQLVKARLLIWRAGSSCAHAATADALCRSVPRCPSVSRASCRRSLSSRLPTLDHETGVSHGQSKRLHDSHREHCLAAQRVPKGEFCTDRSEYSRIANSATRSAWREGSTEDRGRIWCYWGRTYRQRGSTDRARCAPRQQQECPVEAKRSRSTF